MRWLGRIIRWIAMSLSAVLLFGTVTLWIRSWGHDEGWIWYHVEREFEVGQPDQRSVWVAFRVYQLRAIHGRLWVGGSPGMGPKNSWPEELSHSRSITPNELEAWSKRWLDGSDDSNAWTGQFAGVGFRLSKYPYDYEHSVTRGEKTWIVIPFWLLTILFGLWPALFITGRILRRHRRGAGQCSTCGYDLRATPERCPECGTVIESRNAIPQPRSGDKR